MKEVIRLTEDDLHKIIQKSVERIVRETRNDDIVNGIESEEEDDKSQYYNNRILHDDDENDLLGKMNDKYENEDSDMKDYFDDLNADQWIGKEDEY